MWLINVVDIQSLTQSGDSFSGKPLIYRKSSNIQDTKHCYLSSNLRKSDRKDFKVFPLEKVFKVHWQLQDFTHYNMHIFYFPHIKCVLERTERTAQQWKPRIIQQAVGAVLLVLPLPPLSHMESHGISASLCVNDGYDLQLQPSPFIPCGHSLLYKVEPMMN